MDTLVYMEKKKRHEIKGGGRERIMGGNKTKKKDDRKARGGESDLKTSSRKNVLGVWKRSQGRLGGSPL